MGCSAGQPGGPEQPHEGEFPLDPTERKAKWLLGGDGAEVVAAQGMGGWAWSLGWPEGPLLLPGQLGGALQSRCFLPPLRFLLFPGGFRHRTCLVTHVPCVTCLWGARQAGDPHAALVGGCGVTPTAPAAGPKGWMDHAGGGKSFAMDSQGVSLVSGNRWRFLTPTP